MVKKNFLTTFFVVILLCFTSVDIFAETINEKEPVEHSTSADNSAIQVLSYKNSIITITNTDVYLMAQVVFAESRAEPYEGKIGVASVILNRVMASGFPKTIEGVVKQKGAFSCLVNGKINASPDQESFNAVHDALKGKDPTGNALFFYNPKISTCKWMKAVKKSNSKSIGNHVFFHVE